MAALIALGPWASKARSASHAAPITITMIANSIQQPAYDVLIPNFERVYPNITVDATYEATGVQYQLTTTELAAGNAPDLITSWPGCGQPISVCLLAKEGYLAPMIGVPWTKLSSQLVISASKYGRGLFVYSPSVSFVGLFTNDTLFRKLGLRVPQTLPQLLSVCRKAKADGTVAILLPASAGSGTGIANMVTDLALSTVYARDHHWAGELRAGKVSFDGTPGWHEALKEFVDMNEAGCFEPGAAAVSSLQSQTEFAQGQGLMVPALSSNKGQIAALAPPFPFSQHPFPGNTDPRKPIGMFSLGSGPAVNAHSSTASRAAAQTFVNFIARRSQDALEAQLSGGLSQFAFKNGQLPGYMSSFAPLLAAHEYALSPAQSWWNAGVASVLSQYGTGLLTGQSSIDAVLRATDAAWRQGPG